VALELRPPPGEAAHSRDRQNAAREIAGFGGGGMHGYRSLEGTFLGGCLFSGRTAGHALAGATA
jgi:predicted oxidoreductase